MRARAVCLFCLIALVACGRPAPPPARSLRIFCAPALTPLLDSIRSDLRRDRGIELLVEVSGSIVACRKVSELGRECDLLMLADSEPVGRLLGGVCSWRLDFAGDEVVLAVGTRAPEPERAEEDWARALLENDVRIGRVDENLGPIGYRTLQVWMLQEQNGYPGLAQRLLAKCVVVADDVGRLTPLLKTGELDYAFIYRSSCVAHDIRYIALDPRVNLGSDNVDYSSATVTFAVLRAGARESITVRGSPVVWTLTVPDRGADTKTAADFIRYLLEKGCDAIERNGFRPLRPAKYYGPASGLEPFAGLAVRAGERP